MTDNEIYDLGENYGIGPEYLGKSRIDGLPVYKRQNGTIFKRDTGTGEIIEIYSMESYFTRKKPGES